MTQIELAQWVRVTLTLVEIGILTLVLKEIKR